eukprot:TRINITY_DN2589_c0_g1_i2.p1 TRINITY_DN2589_c0_g1~~TRINITY_DN2589_c0_g1_i2.p1  ORF type:complete len:542 (-),score=191.99 TRINITY_DN2589_c0_g1_i2:212-1837(-)
MDSLSDEEERIEEVEEIIPQETMDAEFLKACKSGNYEEANKWLEKGANINISDERKWNGLIFAACNGHVKVAQLLLEKGIEHYCPVIIKEEDEKEAGTNEDEVDEEEEEIPNEEVESKQKEAPTMVNSPLHWACFKGHEQVMWVLLNNGYSIKDMDEIGNTALHLACSGGKIAIVEQILQHGTELRARNLIGNTPFDVATRPAIRGLLKSVSKPRCKCGEEFCERMPRHLCDLCHDTYCGNCGEGNDVMVDAENDLSRLIWRCSACWRKIKEAEGALRDAIEGQGSVLNERITNLAVCLEDSRKIIRDKILIQKAENQLVQLRFQQRLFKVKASISKSRPITQQSQLTDLRGVVKECIAQGGQAAEDAQSLLNTLQIECTLSGTLAVCKRIEVATKSNLAQMKRLNNALTEAEGRAVTESLITESKSLLKRLRLEVDLVEAMKSPIVTSIDDETQSFDHRDGFVCDNEIASLAHRCERLEKELDNLQPDVNAEVAEKAKNNLEELRELHARLQAEEEERIRKEEEERLRREKKKKKKGKKK